MRSDIKQTLNFFRLITVRDKTSEMIIYKDHLYWVRKEREMELMRAISYTWA